MGKFETRNNFTEYFVASNDVTTSEKVQATYIDTENELIYVILEVNRNKYHSQTAYEPGDSPGSPNPNIAVVAYSFSFATRLWVVVLGDPTFADYFSGLQVYGSSVYLVLTSHSTKYTTDSSKTDILYVKLRASNGEIESKQVFGSPTEDKALDIQVTAQGIFILAKIGDTFLPNPTSGNHWKTLGSNGSNLAILFVTFENVLLDVEGFDLATLPSPMPIRMFRPYKTGQLFDIILFAHRADQETSGAVFTKVTNSELLFITNTDGYCASSDCLRCSPKDSSKCLTCQSGKLLYNHNCYSTCPDFNYQALDELDAPLDFCASCHYTCKQCVGPKVTQCSACCIGGSCGSTLLDREPNSGRCECPTSKVESSGLCLDRCSLGLRGKYMDKCYPGCPSDSYPMLDWDMATAQDFSHYDNALVSLTSQDCMDFSNHLTFTGSGKGITVPGPPDLDQMLEEFTISFWIYPTAFNAESYLLNAFERVHITASASNKLKFKYANSAGTFLEPDYTSNDLSLNTWNYVAASLKEEKNPTLFAYLQQTLVLATSRNAAAVLVGTKTDHPKPSYSHFRNSMVIGAFDEATPKSFSGSLRELKLFETYHGEAQLIAEKARMQKGYSYDDPHLIAYWKFDDAYTAADLSYTVRDQSKYAQSLSITNEVGSGSSYPNFQTGTLINLCFSHDVATCITVDKSQGRLHPITVGAYRYTKPPVFDIASLPNYYTISEGDELRYVHVESPSSDIKAKVTHFSQKISRMCTRAVPGKKTRHFLFPFFLVEFTT